MLLHVNYIGLHCTNKRCRCKYVCIHVYVCMSMYKVDSLNDLPTLEEVQTSISKLNLGKAAGKDGLFSEIFPKPKFYWHLFVTSSTQMTMPWSHIQNPICSALWIEYRKYARRSASRLV